MRSWKDQRVPTARDETSADIAWPVSAAPAGRVSVAADPTLDQWWTMPVQRRVLVVATTVTSLQRLRAILPILAGDFRVQVVFTRDVESPTVLSGGAADAVAALQCLELSWADARELTWDLILTASETDRVHQLTGPSVLLAHGAGYQKLDLMHRSVAGLSRDRLMHDGQVVHQAIGFSHPAQRRVLAASCPEATDRGQVIGDPCLDTMLEYRHRRDRYRGALNVGDRKLVVLSSTWGPESLLGRQPDLPRRVVAGLDPDQYACCLLTHPGVVAAHGADQLGRWLDSARRLGLITTAAGQGWEPILLSADLVVADEGSIAIYAAALDIPLVAAGGRSWTLPQDSVPAELARRSPRLSEHRDVQSQIEATLAGHDAGRYADLASRVFDQPGTSAARIRALCYRLMDLPEPSTPASFGTLTVPTVSIARPTAFTVAMGEDSAEAEVRRRPATRESCAPPSGTDPHLVVHGLDGPADLLARADVVYLDMTARLALGQFRDWATTAFRAWPAIQLAALVIDTSRCVVIARDGTAAELVAQERPLEPSYRGLAPVPCPVALATASLAYLRHRNGQPIEGTYAARVNGTRYTVLVRAPHEEQRVAERE